MLEPGRRGALVAALAVGVLALPGCAVLSDPMAICTPAIRQRVMDFLGGVAASATVDLVRTTDVQCGDSLPSVHAAALFDPTTEASRAVEGLGEQIDAAGWNVASQKFGAFATYSRSADGQLYWATIAEDPLTSSLLVVTVTAGDGPW